MKKDKLDELHQKSIGQLEKILKDWTKELVDLKLRLRSGKLKNIHQVAGKRDDIARVKTIITEKRLVEGSRGA